MAVEDDYLPTERLVLARPRRHYKVAIHPLHWQLRSQLGAQNRDTLFYPGGSGNAYVQKFNIHTRESETLKVLSFSPRCLVAGHGWVCCGGETGEFAAIPLADAADAGNDDEPEAGLGLSMSFGADAPLPADLSTSSRDDAVLAILSRNRTSRNIFIESKSFGKERVNCITLWAPQRKSAPGGQAYTDTVAVLANNDKHVIVVNLQSVERLDEVTYPDCVNRAVISPDGRLLIAISDDPYLYVHERAAKAPGTPSLFMSRDEPEYEWRACAKVHLKSQRKEDRSDTRGSFAACFSNTGRYLAVGTQYGIISIFDTSALATPGADPLVTTFTSSRPNTDVGAVRDMAFCPGPFDILAWTEDRGRVGLADVRTNYVSRQVLYLSAYDSYEHIMVADRGAIDPRLLERQSSREQIQSLLATGRDQSFVTATGRRSLSRAVRDVRRGDVDRYQSPLTNDETLVLEALQEHRRWREQRARTQGQPASEASPPPFGERPSLRPTMAAESTRGPRERSASVSRAVTDIIGNIRQTREQLRDTQERLRATTRELEETERRRVSGIEPPARTALGLRSGDDALRPARRTPGPPAGEDAPPGTSRSRFDRLSLDRAHQGGVAARGGWSDLDALYSLSMEAPFPGGRDAFLDALLTDSPDWDAATARLRTIRPLGTFSARTAANHPEADETAGLAWSEDGRTLFVGAEDGIYEFHVDITARKMFPSVTMR